VRFPPISRQPTIVAPGAPAVRTELARLRKPVTELEKDVAFPGVDLVTRQLDPRRGRSLRSGAVTRQALLERTAASSLAAVLEVTVLVGTVGMVAILVANSVNA